MYFNRQKRNALDLTGEYTEAIAVNNIEKKIKAYQHFDTDRLPKYLG